MAVEEQYVLAVFLVLIGVADLDGFFAALSYEEADVLGLCHGRLNERVPVGRNGHARLARGCQSVQTERHVIGVAAVLTRSETEVPQIDKVQVARAVVGRLELGGTGVALADERLGRHLGIFDQQVEAG